MTHATKYSDLHQDPQRARDYADLFDEDGTYEHWLWHTVERPLLADRFSELAAAGALRMLDVACGPGRVASLGGDYFLNVRGVDVSAAMVAIARDRNQHTPNLEFVQSDLASYTAEEPVHVVTAWRLLLNAEPDLRRAFFRVAVEQLADGGRILVNVHVNARSAVGLAYRIRGRVPGWGRDDDRVRNVLSLHEVTSMAESQGLSVVRVTYYGYWPRLRGRMGARARRAATMLERRLSPRQLRHGQYFLVELERAPGAG